jgi:hypothetical protein
MASALPTVYALRVKERERKEKEKKTIVQII